MSSYKILNKQVYTSGDYSIVPIRMKDRYNILEWRNEQMYHLRQNRPLTKKNQDYYFDKVISELFEKEEPAQILFSYLKNDECIGYGGLVHINWIDKNAEISFLTDPVIKNELFENYWNVFLELINEVAFNELNFHKIYTYAFDIRPEIYPILDNAGFFKDATLKDHALVNDVYVDVIIHSKFKD